MSPETTSRSGSTRPTVSVGATLPDARNRFSAISKNCEHPFFPSARNHDTLPLWINFRSLSIAAPNSCPLPIPPLDAGSCAAALAYQNHTGRPRCFLRFGQKTASIVRKIFFFVRLCPFWTMNKLKTNTFWEWLPADCMITSLANIKLCAGGQCLPAPRCSRR